MIKRLKYWDNTYYLQETKTLDNFSFIAVILADLFCCDTSRYSYLYSPYSVQMRTLFTQCVWHYIIVSNSTKPKKSHIVLNIRPMFHSYKNCLKDIYFKSTDWFLYVSNMFLNWVTTIVHSLCLLQRICHNTIYFRIRTECRINHIFFMKYTRIRVSSDSYISV